MDVEIFLDCDEVAPHDHELVKVKFMEWYRDGSEIRHNKMSLGSMTPLEKPNRYLVDLGYADPISALRNLHARLRHFGVKVFIHFIQ